MPEDDNIHDWVIATKPGSLRMGDMAEGIKSKESNITGTSYNYYLPTVATDFIKEKSMADSTIINSYLGNNGRIEVTDSLLLLTKEVSLSENNVSEEYLQQKFQFEVKIEGQEGERSAVQTYRNPYNNRWQLRLSTIDVKTDNKGFLQTLDNQLAIYEKDDQKFYIYIGENTVQEGTEDEYVFRLYNAVDNDIDMNLTRSGMTTYVEDPDAIDNSLKSKLKEFKKKDDSHPLGMVEFWVDKVYLVPIEELIEESTWEFTNHYDSISNFVISSVDAYQNGAKQYTSEYLTTTSYLTTKVFFGYEDDHKPSAKPEGWIEEEWENQKANTATIYLTPESGIIFTNLDAGTEYEITEKIREEQQDRIRFGKITYRATEEGEQDVTIDGAHIKGNTETGFMDEVHYINHYISPVNLEISKEVSGSKGEKNKDWHFQVIFTPISSNPQLLTNYSAIKTDATGTEQPESISLSQQENGTYTADFTLKAKEKIVIENLPQGTSYQVTEQEANQGSYQTVSDNAKGTLDTALTKVTFENANYSRHQLILRKEVDGAWGDKNTDFTFQITFTPGADIHFADSYPYTGSKTGDLKLTKQEDGSYVGKISLKHDESITIANIPEQTTYQVEEKGASLTGKNKDGYYTEIIGKQSGILEEEQTQVTFKNTKYSRHQLTIRKQVTGGDSDQNKNWRFEITLKPKEGIPFDTQYPYVGSQINGVSPKEDGTLELSFKDGVYTGEIMLKHGQSVTIKDIPEGTTYTVKEVEANQDGYKTIATTNTTGLLTKEEEIVEFTNQKLSKHNLTISKEVDGSLGDQEKDFTFQVLLTPPFGETIEKEYTYTGSKAGTLQMTDQQDGTFMGTITLKHGQSITIQGLLEGTTYEVKETEANQDGYITRVEGNTQGIIVDKIETLEVKFINTKLSHHSLTISKEVTGSDGDKDKEFTFQVILKPAENITLETAYQTMGGNTAEVEIPTQKTIELKKQTDGSSIGTITLKHGQSLTILDLPEGTTYEVKETEANQDGYITQVEGNVTGTLSEQPNASIKFVNKKPSKHDITISKEVKGNLGDTQKSWTFKITLIPEAGVTLEDGYLTEDGMVKLLLLEKQSDGSSTGTITLKHGQSITIKNLPENTKYTIEELEANQDGYITQAEGNANGILKQPNHSVKFINWKLSKHNLTISKEVKGNLGETEREFTFQITLTIPSIVSFATTQKYLLGEEEKEISFTNHNGNYIATISLKHNQSATLIDLPEGTIYQVEELEANQDGYETIINGNSDGKLETDNQEIHFMNKKYSTHNLTITKEVTGKGADTKRLWHFTITLESEENLLAKEYQTLSNSGNTEVLSMQLQNENTYIAEVTLRGGESITILGLPYGTSYQVEELEANQDGYITTNRNAKGTLLEIENIVSFTNEKKPTANPNTIDSITNYLSLWIISLLVVVISILYICQAKRNI